METKHVRPNVLIYLLTGVLLTVIGACGPATTTPPEEQLEEVTVQLIWFGQGQFHGFYNAIENGFYLEEGLDVEVSPGGPDVEQKQVVAGGSAEFGTDKPVGIIAARDNGVPLVMVAQYMQDSSDIYITKKESGLNTIEDLRGARFGVWFGGGEFQPTLMVSKAGVDPAEINWVAQKWTMVEFYEDKLDVASATTYNEYHIVLDAGYSPDDLTVFRASDFGAQLVQDGIFTTEQMIKERPEVVQAFVNATIRGWKWGLEHPEEAAQIVLKFNPDLDYRKQLLQVEEINKLLIARHAPENGLGYMSMEDWRVSQEALLYLDQIEEPGDLSAAFTTTFWENVPEEYKTLDDLDLGAIRERIEENLAK